MEREKNTSATLFIPSKIFVIGEYAALLGLPAILLNLKPYFEFCLSDESLAPKGFKNWNPHPDSPAGKNLKKMDSSPFLFRKDPHENRGGFGGSTAEFLALSQFIQNKNQKDFFKENNPSHTKVEWISEVFRDYIEKHEDKKIKPSGMDLLSQFYGGFHCIRSIDPNQKKNYLPHEVLSLDSKLSSLNLVVFGTSHIENRKTKTHEHLDLLKINELEIQKTIFKEIIDDAYRAIHDLNLKRLGECFTQYANLLKQMKLESNEVSKDRSDFLSISGVYGIKGCGALQTDAMIVVCENEMARESVKTLGKKKGFYEFESVKNSASGLHVSQELK